MRRYLHFAAQTYLAGVRNGSWEQRLVGSALVRLGVLAVRIKLMLGGRI